MGAAGASDIEESENERFFEILKKSFKKYLHLFGHYGNITFVAEIHRQTTSGRKPFIYMAPWSSG